MITMMTLLQTHTDVYLLLVSLIDTCQNILFDKNGHEGCSKCLFNDDIPCTRVVALILQAGKTDHLLGH